MFFFLLILNQLKYFCFILNEIEIFKIMQKAYEVRLTYEHSSQMSISLIVGFFLTLLTTVVLAKKKCLPHDLI